ncbi:MAG: hypothetical protein WBB74_05140 [Gaiellaceae bacterium]
MPPGVSSAELAGLWKRLSRSLSELERIAADPDELLDEDALPVLAEARYRLHSAAELAVSDRPEHEELATALAEARDVTAEVAEAVEVAGTLAAEPLVPEWRGALFRVRLARLRLTLPPPLAAERAGTKRKQPPFPYAALAATVLALLGAAAFAAGATFELWPLWGAGLALFAGGLLVHRPKP